MKRFAYVLFFCAFWFGISQAQSAEVFYTGKTFRDPFRDPAEITTPDDTTSFEESIKTMTLQGILYSLEKPLAIIDGKIYRVGSPLGSGQVVQIEKETVTVSINGGQVILKQNKGTTNAYAQKKS
jgi:hypothetical protein